MTKITKASHYEEVVDEKEEQVRASNAVYFARGTGVVLAGAVALAAIAGAIQYAIHVVDIYPHVDTTEFVSCCADAIETVSNLTIGNFKNSPAFAACIAKASHIAANVTANVTATATNATATALSTTSVPTMTTALTTAVLAATAARAQDVNSTAALNVTATPAATPAPNATQIAEEGCQLFAGEIAQEERVKETFKAGGLVGAFSTPVLAAGVIAFTFRDKIKSAFGFFGRKHDESLRLLVNSTADSHGNDFSRGFQNA